MPPTKARKAVMVPKYKFTFDTQAMYLFLQHAIENFLVSWIHGYEFRLQVTGNCLAGT